VAAGPAGRLRRGPPASPDELGRLWSAALEGFAAPPPTASAPWPASLPRLPFPDGRFALTLSGFLLLVHPELRPPAALVEALVELARVTRGEVRAYPLHSSAGEPRPDLPGLCSARARRGVDTLVRPTGCAYAPPPGSDRLLVCCRTRGGAPTTHPEQA
jgi:hypothetical protein